MGPEWSARFGAGATAIEEWTTDQPAVMWGSARQSRRMHSVPSSRGSRPLDRPQCLAELVPGLSQITDASSGSQRSAVAQGMIGIAD